MKPRVFDRMTSLGDDARSRMLVLLEEGELTVSELVRILQMPQSTVSRHLKVLAEDGWVSSRSSGTSHYYRAARDLDPEATELWQLVKEDVLQAGLTDDDRERARAVRTERRERSREFFASKAGQWDALRDELFGAHAETFPLLGLLDPEWSVGDLGCGTGAFLATAAPHVKRVVGVDASPEMLEAAGERLAHLHNVGLRLGDLENLPVETDTLDLAVMLLVLHYLPEPGRALAEACRALKPGGRLVVVDMRTHDREAYLEEMGHQWPGFGEETMEKWTERAGLIRFSYRPLRPRIEAEGPLLFVTSARTPKLNEDDDTPLDTRID